MTASRVATIVVGIVLGTTTGAFAQSESGYLSRETAPRYYAPRPIIIDPLDNLAQTERVAFTVPPAYDPYRLTMSEIDYQSYIQAYEQYLAVYTYSRSGQIEYARSSQTEKKARRNEPPTSVKVVQGISAGLSLADQGLDVVDHALETQALKKSLAQYR